MNKKLLLSLLFFAAISAHAATVDTINIFSAAMKRNIKAIVIQPSNTPERKAFPVFYLLHGFGGKYSLWINKVPQLQQLSDKYGCIIVCPDGGYTTLYFDNPLDSSSKFESHFIGELMPYIEKHYPTLNDRKFRAISGNSMGGFGAYYLASRHLDLFYAAGSMSGVLDLNPFSPNSPISKKVTDTTCCKVNWDKFTAFNIADSLKPGQIRLIMDCGLDDYLLQVNRNVHKKLMDRRIAHDYIERPGRHEWDYWKNAVEFQLLFFRKAWDEK
ncbi:alpha/beta hydrolase [Flavihumibacter profundi]|uniref:alpha/beta hydrolase n=1 Tax=Flavihumibacter profundi TaxID=2716883 RepID=UPI001CC77DBE|nr:alpha/beta hydrolase-fold protein [Flavihumibacter profundi]MBZ5856547.1 esterase family protein [Flavihumibacter profundi]